MASLYPQSMSLHTIGYAALKHPELAPELPVPLGNQLGVLQRTPLPTQIRCMSQIASQYLEALLEYQYSDAPLLHDPKSSQYYFSDAFALINYLTSNPDAAIRVAKHPKLLHDVIDKVLKPDIEKDMKACERVGGATFEADFGCMLQFISTVLLRSEHFPVNPPHPKMQELVPLLRGWKRTYKGRYLSKVSERLMDQIEKPEDPDLKVVLSLQNINVVCGFLSCNEKTGLSACAKCRMTRYCSVEHQKKDWKSHKHICEKGLMENQF